MAPAPSLAPAASRRGRSFRNGGSGGPPLITKVAAPKQATIEVEESVVEVDDAEVQRKHDEALVQDMVGKLKKYFGGFDGLRKIFRNMDEDKSGTITTDEMRTALSNYGFTDYTEEQFQVHARPEPDFVLSLLYGLLGTVARCCLDPWVLTR